nr:MAG TPA: hypothetical protein [Caudoviricetes sp.]DAY62727.1 MAG TPA: hypothetical protein [Caudoviricetes sp.]
MNCLLLSELFSGTAYPTSFLDHLWLDSCLSILK